MASKKDFTLPFQDMINLVPKNLRNPTVTSLIDNLFNRFLTKDEAVPLYGYIGRKPSSLDDRTPKVPQPSVERDINALIPIMSFKVGTETHSFTPQDLIRKAEVLGISTNQDTWLYSQGNNYAPPITFDKFTNFFDYYWVANAIPNPPVMAWNSTNAPEYYTIAKPGITDLTKLNVKVAATSAVVLTGTGFKPQTWTLTFSDATNAVLNASGPGILASENNKAVVLTLDNQPVTFVANGSQLLSFNVVRDFYADADGVIVGQASFEAGDKFTITAPFISSTYSVVFSGSTGIKGKLTQVNSLDAFQTVNGFTVAENDRVLVTANDPSENGIYIVKAGDWIKAADDTTVSGAKVFDTFAQQLFISTNDVDGVTWAVTSGGEITNDWQENNYWVKSTELVSMGVDMSKVVQATRPIIEYLADMELNSAVDTGVPSDVGAEYVQTKSEFNQAPLFNLYRYDGTHARLASSVFFYVEDPAAAIDVALQRRVKHAVNESSDYLFAHGLLEDQSLLFFKRNNKLETIWHAGYSTPTFDHAKDLTYAGTGNGVIAITPTNPFIAQQIWTLTSINATQFEVSGSKLKVIPTAYKTITVGAAYDNGLFSVTIVNGSVPFTAGDVFTFRIGNVETTRYVYRDADEQLYDLFGEETADTQGVGAWQVPRMFFNNVAASNGGELPEGTLYSHFRGILANQLDGTPEDRAFGGSIKLWSEQQNLLASLLMQRDLTPLSVIDLAQRQYEIALNTISDVYLKSFVTYLSSNEVLSSSVDRGELLDYILAVRAKDNDVRSVLYDSTSPVVGFPITLPQMGLSPLQVPGVVFDMELGLELMRHHDGHLSPQFQNDQNFRDRMFSPGLTVQRAPGVFSPAVGSYTSTPPIKPFKGELWVYSSGTETIVKAWDVLTDTLTAPVSPNVGEFWYKRDNNELFVWNGAVWVTETDNLAPWAELDLAGILNDLILRVEQRLYNGISAVQRTYFTELEVQNAAASSLASNLQRELATWAATNGFDPTAPDYTPSDAFTWNYGGTLTTNFAAVTGTVPARWYKALTNHQATVSTPLAPIIPTARPNIEPWKLFGTSTSAAIASFISNYKADITLDDLEDTSNGYLIGSTVKAVSYTSAPSVTPLNGLPIVDGLILSAGDRVLLTSEIGGINNGIWVVSSGFWSRAGTALVDKTVITVTSGTEFSGTHWVVTGTPVVDVTAVVLKQARQWKAQMWLDIQAARPNLKLSVDTARDILIPPYVNAGLPWAINALTNELPPSPDTPYMFGEGSPVETVWRKSVEYRYSLAKALFRTDPLGFLGYCWGFEWVKAPTVNILLDGYDMTVPGHPRFRLHGEPISAVTKRNNATALTYSGVPTGPQAIDITLTRSGYTSTRGQSFTIKTSDGLVLGYISQGETKNIVSNGYIIMGLTIDDQGLPFRLGDKFTLKAAAIGDVPELYFEAASYVQFNGFGQIFTQALREGNIDTTAGYAIQAYRGWDVNLGYRAGGLVSTDDLRVFTDNETLPQSAYALRFKRSPYAKDMWLQGLRVQVVGIGASTINQYGQTVALADAPDWLFRVEGYNTRHLGIEYYTYGSAATHTTFNALSKEHTSLEWKHFLGDTTVQTTQLPLTIQGLQNVVTFLFGYADRMYDLGWRFNDDGILNTDAETGRARGWQLDIEKLIDRVYAGTELGQGHVINPFIDRVWIQQDTGLLSKYFDTSLFDVNGHPGVFDTLGTKIESSELNILRRRGMSQIGANVPMFSVHAQLDEYEHLFVFNNLISPSTGAGLIYDPFSGARIVTIKMNGRRQASEALRPEFGGHYLVGDQVKRNLQSSADKISQYYDTDHVFEDELSTRHALALLGFSPKEYMANLDLTERTQFNFWRGLVQMKGTNASIDAFLNNERFQDAKLDEYWAYKLAEYGDSRSKIYPELRIGVTDTLQQFTKLQFISSSLANDGFTTIATDDENRWFSIDDLNGEMTFEAEVVGKYQKTGAQPNTLYKLPFIADKIVGNSALYDVINATTVKTKSTFPANGAFDITGYGPATPKFNPVKLFNYVNPELVEEIPVWHPASGQHTVAALASINIMSDIDPARYNVSTLVAGNANYDPLRMWGAKELGRVWWDTTNLDYIPYYDAAIFANVDERLSRWGSLTDYASVDVVEWVESAVAPVDYDAQATIDAGDTSLDTGSKADGQVHGAKTYQRERLWSNRAIAWSRAGVATAAAHPSFNNSYFDNLALNQESGITYVTLESKTFEQLGIVAGMRVGEWQEDEAVTQPLSEFLVLDKFTKKLSLISNGASSPQQVTVAGASATVSVLAYAHTSTVGELYFSSQALTISPVLDANGLSTGINNVTSYLKVMEVESQTTSIVVVREYTGAGNGTFTVAVGDSFTVDVPDFGLRITAVFTSAGTYDTNITAQLIGAALSNKFKMQDAVQVTEIVGGTSGNLLWVNDNTDLAYTAGYGWRAWSVPTQAQLTADSRVPDSIWYPYVGEWQHSQSATTSVIDNPTETFTLNDGTSIDRYKTSWADWVELKTVVVRQTAETTMNVVITVPENSTTDRVSVYVNGVARLTGTYVLIGTSLSVTAVPAKSEVVVIVRAYTPSATELAFDPVAADNIAIQRQYKIDYQYVEVPVRDDQGSIVSTKYYFWVKNRSSQAQGKTLSVKSVAQLLEVGPSQYLTFQYPSTGLLGADPYSYDAIAIAGLSYVVTKDDTFKLRFTRNFTLRDDPDELDLKDVHTEWSLIRPGQRTRIPEALWNKVVDTAAGQDAAGNALPSPRRSSYDVRNGTRTSYGFGSDQVLAPSDLVQETLLFTILNTTLIDDSGVVNIPDYMDFLDFAQADSFFSSAANTRNTMTRIWNEGTVAQINELFFAVLEDIVASNYELTDIFKTSRLSAYSIKVVNAAPVVPQYE